MRHRIRLSFPSAVAAASLLGLAACGVDGTVDSAGQDTARGAAPTPSQPAHTGTFALAEFEGYANPATGEFELERVTDLRPLAQIAALYEGNGVRTIGQALPRSTPAPWCTGRIANDGVVGSNPPDSFELWTDPASIAAALPGAAVPAACNEGNTSLYSIDGVFCATIRTMNFYDVGWDNVYAQLYLSTGDAATQGAYSYPYGTGAQTLTDGGDPLPDLVGLPEPGGELGIWSYGDLAASGGQGTQTWTFRNATTGAFRFRGRVIGRLAEDCATPDVNEDCDPLELGDNACRLYETSEACTDDLDCVSYSCVAGACADGCRDGLYGATCQSECPGGYTNACNGNGSCDDGRSGSGACTCNEGFHGDACQFSCNDNVQNGAETGEDIGGPCPVPVGGPNEIYYNGYFYRTLDDAPPGAAYGSWVNTCQTTPLPIPSGYELAPYDPAVVTALLTTNTWATHCILFEGGRSWGALGYAPGVDCADSACSSGTTCMEQVSPGTWRVNSCQRRILIRRSATLGVNEIAFNGYAYRTLDDAPPGATYGSWTNTCQTDPLPIPSGYELAPYDPAVVSALLTTNRWATHCILFAGGRSWGALDYSPGADCADSACSVGTTCMEETAPGTWRVNSCSRRIFIRRPL